jgi:hypothetical protein
MVNTDASIYRPGDIVIGSSDPAKSVYSATGTKIMQEGVSVYGSEKELMERHKDIAQLAARSGGTILKLTEQPNKKQNKRKQIKSTVKKPVHEHMYESFINFNNTEQPQEALTPASFVLKFENAFGKIKAKVEDLIQHELAFMLVFTNEDAVVFEPKVGETLILHTPDRQQHEVYYPGVTFDAPDSVKKLMILFRVPSEN